MAELLLHSLAEFRDIVLPCLDAIGASSVVEVGAEDGVFTDVLSEWAGERAEVFAVDPLPADSLVALAAARPNVTLVREISEEALGHLPACDAYFIDGDHNYATVIEELRLIRKSAGRVLPLVFAHDVLWPSGRRDSYCQPDRLDDGRRHEYTFERGVVPGDDGTVTGGFRGMASFAWADREGGPRNGVLTAVEDFLTEEAGYELLVVPAVFGLGVLVPTAEPHADALRTIVGPYATNRLLERLEHNRVSLYLRVLELQDLAVTAHQQHQELMGWHDAAREDALAAREEVQRLALRLEDLEADNRALWDRLREVEAERDAAAAKLDELGQRVTHAAATLDELARSRAFGLAAFVSRVHARAGGGPGLSRQRLRDVLSALGQPRQ